MSIVHIPAGLKPTNDVLEQAFAALGCEPWGGASVFGWSRISDYLRCPYRYYLKHVLKMRSSLVGTSSKAQDTGSFLHALLAAHYAAMLPPPYEADGQLVGYPGYRENAPTPDELLAALRAAGAEVEALAEATRLWEGYNEHWGEDGIQPIAVEMPAGDPAIHTSRYDMVFTITDGIHDGVWIGEHKTASPVTDLDTWRFEGEVLGEVYSWRLSGLDEVFAPLRGVCINVLLKSKVPQYKRIWLPVKEDMIADYARHRAHWTDMVNKHTRAKYWPKSHYGCVARYDRCAFWDHCATLSDSFLTPLK